MDNLTGVLHDLIRIWFEWVRDWEYAGVFVLMAMESSIIPVPSEVVMPPAAFWAAEGRMNFWGVVAAGTLGSYAGSAISYWVAQWIGLPFLRRYGRYVLLTPQKIELAENWVREYGVSGIFIARLLPVIRHLISMPAGILRMPFLRFSFVTLAGSFLWCWILSWYGSKVLGESPHLLDSPEQMVATMKSNLIWFVAGVLVLVLLYACVLLARRRWRRPQAA